MAFDPSVTDIAAAVVIAMIGASSLFYMYVLANSFKAAAKANKKE